MKHFVKKLTGFCVTYLHNPFECQKCIDDMKNENNFEETFTTFYPKKRKEVIHSPVNTDVPLSDFLPFNQTVSEDNNFLMPLLLPSTSLNSCKFSKKKNLGDMYSERYRPNSTFFGKIKKNQIPKNTKKLCNEKFEKSNTVRKQGSKSVPKMTGDKIPGKGTLKRKRWFIEQLQLKNDNYEDDLFEDKKFGHFRNLLEDESDNPENYTGLKTPVFPFSLSPRQSTPSPEYTDCYNTEQLNISRKRGEEYQYRLKRRKKLDLSPEKNEEETPQVVREGKIEPETRPKPDSILESLIEVEKILSSHVTQGERSDTEDDQYFSDVLK